MGTKKESRYATRGYLRGVKKETKVKPKAKREKKKNTAKKGKNPNQPRGPSGKFVKK